MLLNCFFLTESHNPDLPEEEWTLVYEKTTAGAFSQNFGWGKYKVEISGGGGSGAASIRNVSQMELVYCQNGYAGEKQTVIIPIYVGQNQVFSGTVGEGGKGCSVGVYGNPGAYNTGVATYGNVGQGYQNGLTPNIKYEYSGQASHYGLVGGAWTGGSGGGSTGLLIDGILNTVAVGGNGGTVIVNYGGYKTSTGGTGGSGGTTTGLGVSGGTSVSKWATTGTYTSGNGSDGYIRIYKSNLKPEPV